MPKRDYLTYALADAGTIEIRHNDGNRWTSGLFDDLFALRQAVIGLGQLGTLYTSLNAPGDASPSNCMTDRPLRDENIVRIVRIPFDFDPVRPRGVPSNDAELQAAVQQRNRLVAMLTALGWPMPALALSGNGAHAVFRCRITATPELREILTTLYRGLKADYSTSAVAFDSSVRNPARIWRCYGTLNRKGTPTTERPHRMATIVIPPRWDGLDPSLIERLAARFARRQIVRPAPSAAAYRLALGTGDYRSLNVVEWFTTHGLYKRRIGPGKHAVMCPWADQHSMPDQPQGTDTVVWEPSAKAWPTFFCSHDHCDGRSITDVMTLWADADRFCGRLFLAAT